MLRYRFPMVMIGAMALVAAVHVPTPETRSRSSIRPHARSGVEVRHRPIAQEGTAVAPLDPASPGQVVADRGEPSAGAGHAPHRVFPARFIAELTAFLRHN